MHILNHPLRKFEPGVKNSINDEEEEEEEAEDVEDVDEVINQ